MSDTFADLDEPIDLMTYWRQSEQAWRERRPAKAPTGSPGRAREFEPSIYVARTGFDTARLRGAHAPKYRPSVRALPASAARPSLYRKIYDEPIGPIAPALCPDRPTWAQMRHVVCLHHKISATALVSSRRNALHVAARDHAIFLAWAMTPMSFPQIGQKLGGRDHTTILHSIRKTCRAMGIGYDRTDHAADIARRMFEEMWKAAACERVARAVSE